MGTKELVGTLPQWLRLRRPDRDTVLHPSVCYPTYEMGATLAGCRAVPVPVDEGLRPRLDAIDPDDAARALVLWVNSPANPTGALDDLAAAAEWGRAHGVPVFSDECYCEFTWETPPRTILEHGLDGVVAVHSLSKRSNLAGLRVGFYAGDGELVTYLQEVRKHVGLLVPGPAQAAGVVALDDDEHVRGPARAVPLASRADGGRAREMVRVDGAPCRREVSTSGSRSTTVGPSRNAWPVREAHWSARGSSTERGVPTTCVWPWYNLSTDSTSSSSA